MKCAVDDCEQRSKCHGWCNVHYMRWYKHGDPLFPTLARGAPLADRLIWYSRDGANGCRVWIGEIIWNGYGRVYGHGKKVLAHRASYETFVGPIPEGLQIDHLCRNRACILPTHLEPVTASENSRRGWAAVAGTKHSRLLERGPRGFLPKKRDEAA